jgi:uncharacterized protein YabN with tetrapyrrole methylase and pyrophosphatase domain
MRGTLEIVGAGLAIPEHLTWAGLISLSRCEVIHTTLGRQSVDSIPVDLTTVEFRYLLEAYSREKPRPENYAQAVERIMHDVRSGRRVGYLTFGHPMVFDSVTVALHEECRSLKIPLRVHPGISFIDAILVDLELDPNLGVQVYDATTMLHRGLEWDTQVTTILAQPGVYGNEFMADDDHVTLSLRALQTSLSARYPNNHLVHLVTSNYLNTGRPRVVNLLIGGLSSAPVDVAGSGTLIIPAVDPGFSSMLSPAGL